MSDDNKSRITVSYDLGNGVKVTREVSDAEAEAMANGMAFIIVVGIVLAVLFGICWVVYQVVYALVVWVASWDVIVWACLGYALYLCLAFIFAYSHYRNKQKAWVVTGTAFVTPPLAYAALLLLYSIWLGLQPLGKWIASWGKGTWVFLFIGMGMIATVIVGCMVIYKHLNSEEESLVNKNTVTRKQVSRSSEWFYIAADGVQYGPVSIAKIKQLVSLGVITPTSVVKKGDTSWSVAGKIKGLFPHA